MKLDSDYLNKTNFDKYKRIIVAYSGGVDSLVLLHILSLIPKVKEKLFAVHVNHQVSPNSTLWAKHCEKTCKSMGVNFNLLELELKKNRKLSENDLRKFRYRALLNWVQKKDALFTGHHLNDHVETIFFRILRGTGIKGLTGIEEFSQVEGVDLIRPLVNFSKEDILDYADLNKLKWIEDESNEDISFSRNFIRKIIFPSLQNKDLPSYLNSFSYLSKKAKEANEILEEVAYADLKLCSTESSDKLLILKIRELSKARAKNLLFRWLSVRTNLSISSALTEQVYKNVVLAKESKDPVISFGKHDKRGSFQIRKFNGELYHLPLIDNEILNYNKVWKWNPQSPLELPTGTLSMTLKKGLGLSSELSQKGIFIRARTGGERCKPKGRDKSQRLKNLFQEYQVPPWIRNRIPLLYIEDKIAAVSDLWVCEEFLAKKNEEGLVLNWSDNLENKQTL